MGHRRKIRSASGAGLPRTRSQFTVSLAVSCLLVVLSACQVGDPGTENVLRFDQIPTTSPSTTYSYGPDQAHRVDLYRPQGWTRGGRRPVIVFLHGGAWVAGDQTSLDAAVKAQLRRGWVVLSATYRKAYDAPWPGQAHDIDRLVRWIRSDADRLGIDPGTVVLSGHSAGGHLALMNGLASGEFIDPTLPRRLRVESPRPQAVVAMSAPTDLTSLDFVLFGTSSDEIVNTLLGCPLPPTGALPTITCRGEQVRAASPLYRVSPDDPPVYMVHGDLDDLVDRRQVKALHRRFRAIGRGDVAWLDMVDRYVEDGVVRSFPDRDRGHHPTLHMNLSAFELFLDAVQGGVLR